MFPYSSSPTNSHFPFQPAESPSKTTSANQEANSKTVEDPPTVVTVDQTLGANEEEAIEESDEMDGEEISEHTDESPSEAPSTSTSAPSGQHLSPFERWKIRMSGQTLSTLGQDSPTISARSTPASANATLLQEFRAEVLDGDLFTAIEVDRSKIYKVKDLFHQLSVPSSPGPLLDFIVAFSPHLDQIARDSEERKKRSLLREREEQLRAEVQRSMDSSSSKISTLEERLTQGAKLIEGYDAEIAQIKANIKELQSKLTAVEAKKASVLENLESKAAVEAELNKESAFCLTLMEELDGHNAKVTELIDREQFLSMRLNKAKSLFDSLKADLEL